MRILNFLESKKLLLLLLIIALIISLTWMGFFFVFTRVTPQKPALKKAENGMGGGAVPEKLILADAEPNLELSGIPEPEEFSRPQILTFTSYVLVKGDIIGNIAIRTGLNEDTIISVNDVKNARTMQIGQVIRIPNQDGIYYAVKTGDTLESIAEKYKTTTEHISTANGLFSDALAPNEKLFVPGARLEWANRQEINGDLFIWPCTGYVSSAYGYRTAPFAGTRQFHSGLDIASSLGSPVKAAMAGRVSQVGYDDSFGNFVLINHNAGYRTFYGHMSAVRVKVGDYVETGGRIGDIGSTGLSTGPHLHFTVYKNGVTVNPRSLMR